MADKKTTLLIMAAGIGSRYGVGIKQLEHIGPNGELIIDYSIHDAIQAGFNKIVFIIRPDIEDDFREVIGDRIEAEAGKLGVEIAYAFQRLDDLPEGIDLPEGRTKPLGTGQAVLAARDVISEPFAVINADDYYGKSCYKMLYDFLQDYTPDKPDALCMAGFMLGNTLSDNGGVTRGVCEMDEKGYLTNVVETHHIEKTENGAQSGGKFYPLDTCVSMNMWGLTPEFIERLKTGLVEFMTSLDNPLKDEYLLPTYIGKLLRENKVTVKALPTDDIWFGVTYKEDKDPVIKAMKELISAGVYNADLYADMR